MCHRDRASRCYTLAQLRRAGRRPRRVAFHDAISTLEALALEYGSWPRPAHFASTAARMSRTDAPDACICIACWATSRQTLHSMPSFFPLRHIAVGRARLHETVFVPAMAAALASAEARHIRQDLRDAPRQIGRPPWMTSGERPRGYPGIRSGGRSFLRMRLGHDRRLLDQERRQL